MTTGTDRLQQALVKSVVNAMEMLAFMDATPMSQSGSTVASQLSNWSWVKITEPCTGTLVLALPIELISSIGSAVLGHVPEPGSSEFADSQGELANIVAGRLVFELMGPKARIGLGLPRSGRGAPNVKSPGWVAQEFRVNGHPFAAFVHGDGFIIDIPQAPIRSSSVDETINGFQSSERSLNAEPGVPETLAGYRIISRLGDGGMGVVYKAIHTTLDREAALKVMRPELAQNQRFVARFLREARTAARIDHPNVVTVYDAGMHDGFLFMAMRFVSGGDLAQALKARGPMPQLEALAVCARCLAGLQAIDACGLIHRDIKPANILLELDGMPRLADLGLAREIEVDDKLSQAGSVQGTPAYMSPEQAKGVANLDIRTDIYSMGATLYALLTGEPPFQGDSAYDTVAQVIHNAPRSITSRVSGVDPKVDALVMRALSKDPNERPQTPGEFIDQIREVQDEIGSDISSHSRGKIKSSAADHSHSTSSRSEVRSRSGENWLSRWLRGKSNG